MKHQPDSDIAEINLRIQKLQEKISDLEQKNRVLEAFVENSTDAIQISDRNLNTIRVNHSYEILTGMRREEIVGIPVSELVEKNLISESCGKIVSETKRPHTIVQTFYRTGRRAHVSCKPVFDENGEIEFFICNDRDLDEIASLHSEIRKIRSLNDKYLEELETIKAQTIDGGKIVAKDKATIKVLALAKRVAKVDSTVLLMGETGVGKDEVAQYIHQNSSRSRQKFVAINCSAITESLFESEWFGHEKNAFTGSGGKDKIGFFKAADHGTLFLDEVSELSLNMQAKLLRVLQNKTFIRVGGNEPTKVDVRIIAATNCDLKNMVERKEFREDLYYRLNVFPIIIPPLRERKNDIIPLAQHFLNHYNIKYGFQTRLSPVAEFSLLNYHWNGNVRQLKNIIEQAVILSEGNTIYNDLLPSEISHNINMYEVPQEFTDIKKLLERLELHILNMYYDKYGTVRSAAQHLNMSTTTFLRHRNRLNFKFGDGFEAAP